MKIKIIDAIWRRKFVGSKLNADSGECDFDKCLITQAKSECPQRRRNTLTHEITHAISDALGLDLKERQVHAFATGWLQVLRDNPKLVKYLLKENE